MRNPAVAHIYGNGKSRSKPLCQKSQRNVLIQHRGYLKLQLFYDLIIKKTTPNKFIKFKKSVSIVKQGIKAMMFKPPVPKKKLNINIGLKK